VKQAHKGTLFLDEVGELPMSLQKAFLRVLQEHRFRPLGAAREVESDFRLIAATNRDLDAMAEEGSFRSDLLFRLRSFVIELPPLRKRKEDIKPLTRHFVDNFCEQHNLTPKGLDTEFLQMLMLYPWPGNVRELVNTLERTLSAARFDPTLFPQHLPNHIRVYVRRAALEKGNTEPELPVLNGAPDALPKLQDYREEVLNHAEQQYLTALMFQAHTNIGLACEISGLSQSRLYALLKKYDISRKN
jgi:two-component system NtrC family response regulator